MNFLMILVSQLICELHTYKEDHGRLKCNLSRHYSITLQEFILKKSLEEIGTV